MNRKSKKETIMPSKLRKKGYQALVSQLGQIDTIRFLQQIGWGSGDYTQERQEQLAAVTREKFLQNLHELRAKKAN